jgi:hypothetical protein
MLAEPAENYRPASEGGFRAALFRDVTAVTAFSGHVSYSRWTLRPPTERNTRPAFELLLMRGFFLSETAIDTPSTRYHR